MVATPAAWSAARVEVRRWRKSAMMMARATGGLGRGDRR